MKNTNLIEIHTASQADEQGFKNISDAVYDDDIKSLIAKTHQSYPTVEDEVRNSLTNSLGKLGKSVQQLILLLESNNIVNMLPEVALPVYSDILDSISEAAIEGSQAIVESQSFDMNLELALDECPIIQ